MKNRLILFFIIMLVFVFSQTIEAQDKIWTEVAPGVWKTIIGNPEEIDLYNTAGIKPAVDALTKMGSAQFPFPEKEIETSVRDNKTFIRFPLLRNEEIFGFGLNFKTVQQRGSILQLHVDHYGG